MKNGIVLGILALATSLQGALITWTGATNCDLNLGANWAGGVVPGINDTAVFPTNITNHTLTNSALLQWQGIEFTAGANPVSYSISNVISNLELVSAGSTGVTNNSGVLQSINCIVGANTPQMFVFSGVDLDTTNSGLIENGAEMVLGNNTTGAGAFTLTTGDANLDVTGGNTTIGSLTSTFSSAYLRFRAG